VFSTELGIQLSFVKTLEFRWWGGGPPPPPLVRHWYVPRKQGGRDQMQLRRAHAVEITKLVECVDRKEDPLIQTVRMH
jgi:hypothetical protein